MTAEAISRESLIQAGDRIQQRVDQFRERARVLFYAVMLFQKECIACRSTTLQMEEDGHCRCRECGHAFDPTVAFQTCPDCDEAPALMVHHYWCGRCRRTVRSVFCFDERIFNNDYFREMMQASRQRKREAIDKLRQQLADSRSPPFWPDTAPLLADATDFEAVLAPFVAALPAMPAPIGGVRPIFDLDAYRRHLLKVVPGCLVDFEGVSTLIPDSKLDRVYRFIAAIFLEQEGMLTLDQSPDGSIKLVGV